MKAVTIVIPAFGNDLGLEKAMNSVIAHVDLNKHKLIVINDGGPDAHKVKKRVEKLSQVNDAISYFENPHNIGFVATCNRAINEIDQTENDVLLLNSDTELTPGAFEELIEVLNSSEHHAVVSPRTSVTTISSFPLFPRFDRTSDECFALHQSHKNFLPRYTVSPVAPGFCLLLRRKVIDNYGLFDEAFSPGYEEENDFCLRVNKIGYSAVIAHHAFVHHIGGSSFGDQRYELQQKHWELVTGKHPYYPELIERYLEQDADPADKFVDYLQGTSSPSILVDCSSLNTRMDGTSVNILSFIDFIRELAHSGKLSAQVTFLCNSIAIKQFNLDETGLKFLGHEEQIDGIFDVGFALTPIYEMNKLKLLNKHCSRIVVSHLDIISTRVVELRMQSPQRQKAVFGALEWADKTIFISQSALEDAKQYDPELQIHSSVVIHQGAPEDHGRFSESLKKDSVTFQDKHSGKLSVLVVGNFYPHKQIKLATEALKGLPCEVIALDGMNRTDENIRHIISGQYSQATVSNLYSTADVVVFPSAYEGFGLPVAEAASHQKPLVVFDTSTSREVVSALGLERVTFFSQFRELPELVLSVSESPPRKTAPVRSITQYNFEVFAELLSTASKHVDVAWLRKRHRFLKQVSTSTELSSKHVEWLRDQNNRRSTRLAGKFADVFWGPIYKRFSKN